MHINAAAVRVGTTMLAILLFVWLSEAAVSLKDHYSDDLKNCKLKRDDAVSCMLKFGDTNHDRRLEESEIETLKSNMLYFWEKWVDLLHPVTEIMDHCDYDRDGFISEDDFYKSYRTCMPRCKDVLQFDMYICSRAKYAEAQKLKQ